MVVDSVVFGNEKRPPVAVRAALKSLEGLVPNNPPDLKDEGGSVVLGLAKCANIFDTGGDVNELEADEPPSRLGVLLVVVAVDAKGDGAVLVFLKGLWGVTGVETGILLTGELKLRMLLVAAKKSRW